MSNADFKRRFAALLQRVGDKADTVVRKSALDVLSAVVRRSPVDTGRFRGNWMTALQKIDTSTSAPDDKSGASSLARGQSVLGQFRPGQTIYLTNSLPYARRLEYGWSQQAPQGMVRLSVVEFDQYLKRAVESLR